MTRSVTEKPATPPRERPILFSGSMVRAILEGRKTQTRRVISPQPIRSTCAGQEMWGHKDLGGDFGAHVFGACAAKLLRCPYGAAGDRLWVRESFNLVNPLAGCELNGRPENDGVRYKATWDKANLRWKPSIHMPRWASRLSLEITNVRVERLQAISGDDAGAEGVQIPVNADTKRPLLALTGDHLPISYDWFASAVRGGTDTTADWMRAHYASLWDSLNAKRGFGWDVNPWVFVIEFARVTS